MRYRLAATFTLLLMACLCASISGVRAEVTCSGTLTFASSDYSTSPGTICGNDYTDTADSDDRHECLQEGLVGSYSQLTHIWRFVNLPLGDHYLIFEGNRPSNTDGDNFQFSRKLESCTGFCLYNHISGALISNVFEPDGGTKVSLNLSTEEDGENLLLRIKDTVVNGTHLATVNIDYLAICTE